MKHRTRTTCMGGLLAWLPCIALAQQPAEPPLGAALVALAAVLQFLPLLHLGLNRRFSPCYRTTYCMVYVAAVFVGWVLAALVWELTHALPWSLLPMLLPYVYWATLLARPAATAAGCEVKFRDD